jgi:hypothetical protein
MPPKPKTAAAKAKKTPIKKPQPLSGSQKLKALLNSHKKEEPIAHSFSKSGFKRVIRLAELAGKLKERQRTYPPDRRKDLEPLIKLAMNFDYQLSFCSGDEASLRKDYKSQIENLTAKDYWLYYRSSSQSWKMMCGRAGWYVIDYDNLKTKAFILTVRN